MMRRYGLLILIILLLGVELTAAQAEPSNEEVNMVNAQGQKTGLWRVTASMRPTKGYAPTALIEEGHYKANKKEGLWKKYYATGKVMSEINYVKNIPNGSYKTYYPTGSIEEAGNWVNSRNTGEFKRFHPNGKISQHFQFANNGRRNGAQLYYHENGQVELDVTIVNGMEEGEMTRYYANGDVKEKKTFNGGKVDPSSIKTFAPVKKEVVVEETPAVAVKQSVVVKEDKPNIQLFQATGNNTLYNKDRQISQTGYFKKGRLYDGKWYRYDSDGLLTGIEIYKKGRFIGHAVMEESD